MFKMDVIFMKIVKITIFQNIINFNQNRYMLVMIYRRVQI